VADAGDRTVDCAPWVCELRSRSDADSCPHNTRYYTLESPAVFTDANYPRIQLRGSKSRVLKSVLGDRHQRQSDCNQQTVQSADTQAGWESAAFPGSVDITPGPPSGLCVPWCTVTVQGRATVRRCNIIRPLGQRAGLSLCRLQ